MSFFKIKKWDKKRDRIFLSVLTIIMSLYTSFSCTYFAGAAASVFHEPCLERAEEQDAD